MRPSCSGAKGISHVFPALEKEWNGDGDVVFAALEIVVKGTVINIPCGGGEAISSCCNGFSSVRVNNVFPAIVELAS